MTNQPVINNKSVQLLSGPILGEISKEAYNSLKEKYGGE